MIRLLDLMDHPNGWGREMGREVFGRMAVGFAALSSPSPSTSTMGISLRGIARMDVSFSSETVVEFARRLRGGSGIYLAHIEVPEIEENIDAAARRVEQPMLVMDGSTTRFIGQQPSAGTRAALELAIHRPQTRAVDVATDLDISVANASMKLKQLWTGGFLLRREQAAETGGIEFVYHAIA